MDLSANYVCRHACISVWKVDNLTKIFTLEDLLIVLYVVEFVWGLWAYVCMDVVVLGAYACFPEHL